LETIGSRDFSISDARTLQADFDPGRPYALRSRAFLLGKPDAYLGNVGERGDRRKFAGRVTQDLYMFSFLPSHP
jgi:hypothetical protein